jgi:arsenate reductase
VEQIRVLFLCTGNSARSIIAEALLRELGGARFSVRSAGVEPRGLHEQTIATLRDAGIDTAGLRSEHVDAYAGQRFDYVITLCDDAAERCPVFPGGATRLHWSLPDPAAVAEDERPRAFADTRETLRRLIAEYVESIAVS